MNVIPFRRQPPSLPMPKWDIYRAASKARWIGSVEAPTADSAIRAAAKVFNIPDTKKLIAVQRR